MQGKMSSPGKQPNFSKDRTRRAWVGSQEKNRVEKTTVNAKPKTNTQTRLTLTCVKSKIMCGNEKDIDVTLCGKKYT
jgi:hypothetical protein